MIEKKINISMSLLQFELILQNTSTILLEFVIVTASSTVFPQAELERTSGV